MTFVQLCMIGIHKSPGPVENTAVDLHVIKIDCVFYEEIISSLHKHLSLGMRKSVILARGKYQLQGQP